jgi:type IV pilus assembly protein PilO
MASLPTSQRDQLLLAVGFLAVLGAGAYWYFVDEPRRNGPEGLVAMQMHLDSLNASNQRAKAQQARGNVAQIRAEADSLRANLEVLRTLVPASNEVPALIEQVSNAARRVRLELGSIDPQPPIEGEMFDTHRYRLRLNGSYHDLGAVLTNIASLNRVVAPINLSLALGNPPGGREVPGKQFLTATFDIQTYVIRTAPPAGAKP